MSQILTPVQVANAKGVPAWRVREDARTGVLPGVVVSGVWTFTPRAVAAYAPPSRRRGRPVGAKDKRPRRRKGEGE